MAENRELQLVLRMKDEASKSLGKLADSVEKNKSTLKGMALTGTAATVSLALGIRSVINASNDLASSLVGLDTVANAFNQDVTAAKQAAIELASDGLLSVKSAANSLKNLLATGFSLPESIKLMEGFKDAAAFNRQGTLEFGQAIEGATQGLKNQNSIMVDNAGVTKNLSVILKEAGFSQQDLMNVTTDASVRTALYNGILKETSIFQGDATKSAELLQGKQAKLSTSVFTLKAAVGDSLAPAIADLIDIVTPIVNNTREWVEENKTLVKVAAGLTVAIAGLTTAFASLGLVVLVLKTSFINLIPVVKTLGVAFTTALGPLSITITAMTVLAGVISNKLNKRYDEARKKSEEMTASTDRMIQELISARQPIKQVSEAIGEMSEEAKAAADKIKGLEEEITKSFKDNASKQVKFKEDLATAIVEQEEKVADLTKQVKEKELEASKTAIKSSTQEELRILKDKLSAEETSLQKAKEQKFGIEAEIIEMRRRSELTDFELRIENIQRKRVADLKEFKDKLTLQLQELNTLKAQHKAIETAEAQHTKKMNDEAEARAKKEESVAQRILNARARVSGLSVATAQTTPSIIPSTQFAGAGVGTTINISGNQLLSEDAGDTIAEQIMNSLRFNQKIQ